jgi:putative ABC transport system permease protein
MAGQRAVGMSRHQIRTMVRAEAVILAVFGAATGVVLGTGIGPLLVAPPRRQGITEFVVPAASLAVFLVRAAVLGLIAATWPGRAAARLDRLGPMAAQ